MCDKLLRKFAQELLHITEEPDKLLRIGGDEFVLLLNHAFSKKAIQKKIEKIAELFKKPWVVDNQEIIMTTSMGISLYPKDGESYSALMTKADLAMYKVKSMGRNGHCFYDSSLSAKY